MTSDTDAQAPSASAPRTWQMLIGEGARADVHEWIDVVDPGVGEVFARVPQATGRDLDAAVSAARGSFDDQRWRGLTADTRTQVMWRVAELIDEHADELADLETRNQGMPVFIARGVVLPGISRLFRYYAGAIERVEGRATEFRSPSGGEMFGYTRKEPIGVAGIIVPWNAPLMLLSWKLAPALAAGCSVVVKPAEETPLTALRIAELCLEAGLPPGVVNVVTGVGHRTGAEMAAHPGIDKISFTGSTSVGRSIISAATGNLKKVTLELGGKSPVLIFPDADLDRAIPGAANAIFSNAGQVCTAGSRLLVHSSVFDRVVEGLATAARNVKLGYRTDNGAQVGPLISDTHRHNVHARVEQGVADGAEIVTGGAPRAGAGYFYEPTVIVGASESTQLVREEIFGPVVAVMKFENEAEAVTRANNSDYGLAGSVWSTNLDRAIRVAGELRAGRVGINVHASPELLMPTGGYRQSGWGRELGPDGIEPYLETKSVHMAVERDR